MFANFERQRVQLAEVAINLVKGGSGPPLLLLHGYPQTHLIWHKLAPRLAVDFTVIATDLRGYGDSSKPPGNSDHSNYAKRVMAGDQVAVMEQLGYETFHLAGHDRGGRVAHRLALDYAQRVKKLVLLDIVPTYDLYLTADREFAQAYYHWFFLTQPYPLPETLIGAAPRFFLHQCLQNWSRQPDAFTPEAIAEYERCFCRPDAIHSSCEDYRAAATVDWDCDGGDRDRKIRAPLLVLWGSRGIIGRKYDVLGLWQQRAETVRGQAIPCGHFLPEEAPEATYQALRSFLFA